MTRDKRKFFSPLRILFLAVSLNFLCIEAHPATLLDDGNANIGYVSENETGTEDNPIVLIQSDSDQALQLNFDFDSAGAYSQLTKNFSLFNMGELARSNVALQFYARGLGPDNLVRFRLTDVDGDQIYQTFSGLSQNGNWQAVSIPLASFTLSSSGNGQFDLFKVKKVEIALEKNSGGTGTLDIDRLRLVRTLDQGSSAILLDNFEGGTGSPNNFGGPIGTFTQDTGASLTTTYDSSQGNVFNGNFSLKLTYNAGTLTTVENAGYFNGPAGTDLSGMEQIEFYAKASNDNEAFRLKFGSTTQNQVINVGGIGTDWQRIVIPYENFEKLISSGVAGGTGLSTVTEFVLVFTPNVSVGSGDLWIDDIRFIKPDTSSGTIKIIDEMEEPTDPALTTWFAAYDTGSFATLDSISDGVEGRALRLTCEMKSGSYCTMVREFYVNTTLPDSFRFNYKYTGLSSGIEATNDFEFNLLDSEDVRFKFDLPNLNNTHNTWKTMTLPLSDFKEVSGGSTIDLRKIKEIRFTLLKDDGGSGLFAIDDLEVLSAPKLESSEPDRLIQNLSTDNNPFSPNGDGLRDTVQFSYTLKERASTRLRIYDTKGLVIKELKETGVESSGKKMIIWNGQDSSNSLVANGLYFYQLRAESVKASTKDRETGVVAVLR